MSQNKAIQNREGEMETVRRLLFRLVLLLLLLLLQPPAGIASVARSYTLHPHCQASCGDYSIPYPFGIGPDCYRDERFGITCKMNKEKGIMMPYAGTNESNICVFNFSVPQCQATMLKHLRYACYNATRNMNQQQSALDLSTSPFIVSSARNKFTAIGCNTDAYIEASRYSYKSGCVSFCDISILDRNISGSCTGQGCCQTSIPEDLMDYKANFYRRPENDSTWEFNPCSYAFVADENWFKFNVSYLKGSYFKQEFRPGVPLVLDWVVENITCDEARKNSSSYACRSRNSNCTYRQSLGYACKCSQGYEGNPYLENGCEGMTYIT